MSDKKCSYSVTDGVAVMTVDNPPMNALSAPVLTDIEASVKEALADDAVRVVVFTGAGERAFIAGADIKEFGVLVDKASGSMFLKYGQDISNLIASSDKPFIAAINGFCLGGGLEYALACHIRLADEDAHIGLPEIKLGVIPGYGGTQRTPRFIGKSRALELILSGNFISGAQAADYGIVNRVVPAGTVVEEAVTLGKTIASRSRMAIKAALKAVNQGFDMSLEEGMALERDCFGEMCETQDKEEGVSAFLEKREPNFRDC